MFSRRPATLSDLPQIVALDRLIFGAYGADEDPAVIEARLCVFPNGCQVLITDVGAGDQQIAGYLTTEKWATARQPALDEDPHLTHHPEGRVLNITTLAVHPDYQKRGLGARLLAYALELARREGCAEIILETAHAEQFYRRHGFTKIGERTQRAIRLAIMRRAVASPG